MNNEIKVFITVEYLPSHPCEDEYSQIYPYIYFGAWIDATLPPEEIEKEIIIILDKYCNVGVGYKITATEGFGTFQISPWANHISISRTAQFIKKYPDFGGQLLTLSDDNVDLANTMVEKQYLGCYKSIDDFLKYCVSKGYKQYADLFKGYTNYRDLEKTLYKQQILFIIALQPDKMHMFSTKRIPLL